MYDVFQTDMDLEKTGIKIDYGPFYFVIARAGGNNKRYGARLDALLKPYRRAIQTETMDEEVAKGLMAQAYAETVVLGWGSPDKDGKPVDGKVPGKDGKLLDFTVANVKQVLLDLPDLFRDIREQAEKAALFRAMVKEADAKN
jgi:hypothetical protein